jgi:hypothetical protein
MIRCTEGHLDSLSTNRNACAGPKQFLFFPHQINAGLPDIYSKILIARLLQEVPTQSFKLLRALGNKIPMDRSMQAIPGARRGAGGRHDDFSSDVESDSRKKTRGNKVNSGVFFVFTCL